MIEVHGLDTQECVFFYEHDFYVLSNFSAFNLSWYGATYPTSEHCYQAQKFLPNGRSATQADIAWAIKHAASAHAAFKLAEKWRAFRCPYWDERKVDVMRAILRAKVNQHDYVRSKLIATGDRALIEDSWRDAFWGWGPNRDGQNMLGKLWMEIRAELRA